MYKLFHDLFDDPSIEVCLIFFQAILPSLTNVDVATWWITHSCAEISFNTFYKKHNVGIWSSLSSYTVTGGEHWLHWILFALQALLVGDILAMRYLTNWCLIQGSLLKYANWINVTFKLNFNFRSVEYVVETFPLLNVIDSLNYSDSSLIILLWPTKISEKLYNIL